MSYYEKYLKYKQKYINLKSSMEGGDDEIITLLDLRNITNLCFTLKFNAYDIGTMTDDHEICMQIFSNGCTVRHMLPIVNNLRK
jgi:hypothetical protein